MRRFIAAAIAFVCVTAWLFQGLIFGLVDGQCSNYSTGCVGEPPASAPIMRLVHAAPTFYVGRWFTHG